MYNILSYFQSSSTCKTQASKSDNSYEYTKRNNVTIFFNNTVAGLVKSWREFKEKAYGMMYDVGTWLEKIYKSVTKQAKAHNLNAQATEAQHGEEREMAEFIPGVKTHNTELQKGLEEFNPELHNRQFDKKGHRRELNNLSLCRGPQTLNFSQDIPVVTQYMSQTKQL